MRHRGLLQAHVLLHLDREVWLFSRDICKGALRTVLTWQLFMQLVAFDGLFTGYRWHAAFLTALIDV